MAEAEWLTIDMTSRHSSFEGARKAGGSENLYATSKHNPSDLGFATFAAGTRSCSAIQARTVSPSLYPMARKAQDGPPRGRETTFEGNADDSMAAADALIDHGLLRVKLTSEGRERTAKVRVREQIVRVFAVSKSILDWRGERPAV